MIGKFMTRRTQPDHFQRLLIVVMVGMGFTRTTAENAVVRANQLPTFDSQVNRRFTPEPAGIFRKVALDMLFHFPWMIRSPFTVGFLRPLAELVSVVLNVLLVPFIYFLGISLAVLALLSGNALFVFKIVLPIIFFACFSVFEWHGSYHTTNMSLSGGLNAE